MSGTRGAVAIMVFFVFIFAVCFSASAAEPVTVEQAREIALSRTGNSGMIVDTDIDYKRGGGFVYEFEIVDDGVKFEIEIDGSTGGILEFSREDRRSRSIIPTYPNANSGRTPSLASARMTSEEAQKLALEMVDGGGGSVAHYKLDWDDGRYVHEVTVVRDDKRYKFEIEDSTGAVGELSVKQQKK